MRKTTWNRLRVLLVVVAAAALACVGAIVWFSETPWIDPEPKGEGSYKELSDLIDGFKEYHESNNQEALPDRFVRVTLLDPDYPKEPGAWMVYHATGSHSKIRGGTLVIMDSTGRIDGYFGHHCSRLDGGPIIAGSERLTGVLFERADDVRALLEKGTFHHQITEQAGVGRP